MYLGCLAHIGASRKGLIIVLVLGIVIESRFGWANRRTFFQKKVLFFLAIVGFHLSQNIFLAHALSHSGGGGDRDGDRPPASGSPPGWEEGYKLWEAKFRCTNLKTHRKHHSQGMASIDSSAPETTSSDNSPTLVS